MGADDYIRAGQSHDSDSDSDESEKTTADDYIGGYTGPRSGDCTYNSRQRWVTKLDYSTSYILIARDRRGEIYYHQGNLAILDSADDWRRLDDHPNKEFEVLYRVNTEQDWLRFCNHAQDQLGVDPREVIESDPARIQEIEDRVMLPPGGKPNHTRKCRICGKSEVREDTTLVEMNLDTQRKVPVCTDHTVEELAYEGLLN